MQTTIETTTIETIITPKQEAEEAMRENEALLRSRATRPVVKITVNQFVDLVCNNAGSAGYVTAYVITKLGHDKDCGQKLNKKHRETKVPAVELLNLPVSKCTAINFNLWADYKRLVEVQREREGTPGEFKLSETWHERFEGRRGSFFVHHKEDDSRVYLAAPEPKTIRKSQHFQSNGEEMTDEETSMMYKHLMSDKKHPVNQGVEKAITFKVYKIEGIRFFVMKGVIYEVMQ